MAPDMSVNEMVDSFIYIVKGARVIERKATDWGRAYWFPEKYVKDKVYTLAELKRYFAHRVVKSKYKSECCDPFGDWLKHPDKWSVATLSDAMKFADMATRGLIEPIIDLEQQIQDAKAKLQRAECVERARAEGKIGPQEPMPQWIKGQLEEKALLEAQREKKRLALNQAISRVRDYVPARPVFI